MSKSSESAGYADSRRQALALRQLRKAFASGRIETGELALKTASLDTCRLAHMPAAVLHPACDEEVSATLRLANKYRVPVTTRGAGSATTGATTPILGGWVLDLSSWDSIEIDAVSGYAHVGAGALNAKIDEAAAKKGWFYPPDPSSKGYSTIGGNIACNAGGLRAAKYGVTRDYVVALEGFLPTGEPVKWGLPLKKYVSGFNLRDLWIGSEGMLGVVTKATLKLIPRPSVRATWLAAYKSEAAALRTVKRILKARLVPSILEFIDRQTLECFLRKHERAGTLGTLPFRVKPGDLAPAMLLMEIDGDAAQVRRQLKGARELLGTGAQWVRQARDDAQAEALWRIRRTCSQAMFQMGDTKLNEDIVVPLDAQLPLLKYTLEVKKKTGLATPTFGHAADGNFHVHVMFDWDDPEQRARAKTSIELIMRKVVELGGSITGEHGIGLAKSPFLHLQHTEAEIAAMRRIKDALDPAWILNPGKMFEPFDMWQVPRVRDWRFPWDH
ncbi:FAD-linked oxidase C-terminal domain-containing protein [Ruficoccus sp. ZRK36]|uniref:FAD-binding oxidoreductase n=1 Tax=Ruficoccus sp. ZRK36 TaxID=2866311 RepID=UPI001C72B997|nr:FAD-linked oxidase C-terminal domain-containing protein [Ruficoccus sp. ZRK36]QYY34427.1 FAD-binding protein [Ruficoccus sp. ZRK36]